MTREEYTEIDNYNLSEMLFNRDERLIEMIKGLREERDYIFNKLTCEKGYLQEKLDKKEDRIDKAIEYITSYESIEEIQHCERIEDNKDLDYKTMVEMNRRYLIVHDKLLDILRGEDNE